MKTSIIALLIMVLSAAAFPQDNCNCELSLSLLIDEMESEYPGFQEKTADTIMYRDFKERLILKSRSAEDAYCPDLLKHYLAYFRDPHIRLIQTNAVQEAPADPADNQPASTVDITLDEFYDHIARSDDQLEGVWKSPSYRVGVVKAGDEYQGFIIEAGNESWHAFEIKFRLMDGGAGTYYMGDHSGVDDTWEQHDGCILFFKDYNISFTKELPAPKLSEGEIQQRLDKLIGFYFTELTDRTALLCISSFEDPYVERIEKMVSDNKQAIEHCENLIIDIRNNLGGTYDAYDEILPYVLTGNMRGVGQEFLVTQTLIDGVEDWFDDEAGKAKARRWISMFEGKIGQFVNTDTADVSVSDIEIAEHSPKQIVILANKRTASSGEAFILAAKQSKKVKVLGVPTYGALDYGSASVFEFGCANYKVQMPTWRAMRLPDYPVDNIGLQPDIYLDKSVEDWVQFAVDYLEN